MQANSQYPASPSSAYTVPRPFYKTWHTKRWLGGVVAFLGLAAPFIGILAFLFLWKTRTMSPKSRAIVAGVYALFLVLSIGGASGEATQGQSAERNAGSGSYNGCYYVTTSDGSSARLCD